MSLPEPPDFGQLVEVRPGLMWLRFPLPMKVGSANIYLLEERDGWAVIDTGMGDEAGIAHWQQLLDGPLASFPLSRVIVTHSHVDHIGAAGWLCERLEVPLWMGRDEYREARLMQADVEQVGRLGQQAVYKSLGIDSGDCTAIAAFHRFNQKGIATLPDTFHALEPESVTLIGDRRFSITAGGGHSPAQIMLHAPEDGLFFCADQILADGPPLLTISFAEPDQDSYRDYLASLDRIGREVADSTVILSGHGCLFQGATLAIGRIRRYHATRIDAVLEQCAREPVSILAVMENLFGSGLSPRQLHFAAGEVVAYANHLVATHKARWQATVRKSGAVRLLTAI